MLKIVLRPERRRGSIEESVGLAGADAFDMGYAAGEAFQWSKEHVHVVRHQDPGAQFE
jgi:hypothetical protein